MFRGTFALFNRTMRESSRRHRMHLLHLASVVLMLVFLIAAHVLSQFYGAPGLHFFRTICNLDILLISLAGISYFAPAITMEKEEGTLGLLTIADVSSLAILMGTSTSRLMIVGLAFIAQIPFAVLCATLGGITLSQIAATYLCLFAYLLLVANLAVLISLFSRQSSTASMRMLLALFVLLGLPPALIYARMMLAGQGLLARWDTELDLIQTWAERAQSFNVAGATDTVLTTGYSGPLVPEQVPLTLLAAAACFAVAWIAFEPMTRYEHSASPKPRAKKTTLRHWRWIARPWRNPLAWKDFYFIAGGGRAALIKFTFYGLLLYALYRYEAWLRYYTQSAFAEMAVWTLVAAAAVETAWFASRIFYEERKDGTLANLLLLPVGPAYITYSKIAGCFIGLLPVAACLGGIVAVYFDGRLIGSEVTVGKLLVAVAVFAVLIHLTMFYSFLVNRGALALAVATLLILGSFIMPAIAVLTAITRASAETLLGEVAPILYFGGTICLVIQFLILVQVQHSGE